MKGINASKYLKLLKDEAKDFAYICFKKFNKLFKNK
jgi:hypothetical protein